MKLKGRVLALYREARTLDPDNSHATDALRGLGRGVRTWRTTAALLPVPNEEALTVSERGARLRKLGEAARETDANEALTWFERAVAVNADDTAAWDAIVAIALDRRDYEYAFVASVEAMHAYERVVKASASQVSAYAQRIAETASVARQAGSNDVAVALSGIAFAIDPTVPAVAMLVADARFDAGDKQAADGLYTRILDYPSEVLTAEQRAHAMLRRGLIAIEAGSLDDAHKSLQHSLESSPFSSEALAAMADVLRREGAPISAALHQLKALPR